MPGLHPIVTGLEQENKQKQRRLHFLSKLLYDLKKKRVGGGLSFLGAVHGSLAAESFVLALQIRVGLAASTGVRVGHHLGNVLADRGQMHTCV